jgi:hypothetical protein
MRVRFSIRDLLWLTLVVGMAVAWWIDHRVSRTDKHYVIREVPNILPDYSGKTCLEIVNLKTGSKRYQQPLP